MSFFLSLHLGNEKPELREYWPVYIHDKVDKDSVLLQKRHENWEIMYALKIIKIRRLKYHFHIVQRAVRHLQTVMSLYDVDVNFLLSRWQ